MKTKLLPLGLLFFAVGCTDTFDTICREYRNTNNEAIDALTMVTDNDSAKRYTMRIFGPMMHRYKDIDTKVKIIEVNRTKSDFVKELFESDGFQLYIADLEVNRQRMALEVTRLRYLLKQYGDKERDRLDAEGERNKEVNLAVVCKELYDLVEIESNLEPLRNQLTKPKLFDMMAQFPNWKVKNYEILYGKFIEKRKQITKTQSERPDVKLVN